MMTLAQLLDTPDLLTVFDRMMSGLKGVGWVRHTVGISVGSVDIEGSPTSQADLFLTIIATGGLGVGTFAYSLDGGDTFSITLTIPADGVYIEPTTGVTVTFDDTGATLTGFQQGDVWECNLTTPSFPVTSWQPFSVPLTEIQVDAEAMQALFVLLEKLGNGGYIGTAAGSFLDLIGQQIFNTFRRQGVVAQGLVTLTNSGGADEAIPASQLIVSTGVIGIGSTPAGLKYTSIADVVVPANGTAQVKVQAELVGAQFNVPLGTIQNMVSTQPGITVNNPDPGNGTWVTQSGADRDTDAQYAQVLYAKFPALGYGVPSPNYDTWAKAASPSVTKTTPRIDQTTGGLLHLYLAGAAGGVPSDVVTAVQNYINPRAPDGVSVDVESAATFAQAVVATVFVFKGFEAQVTAAVNAAAAALQTAAPINGTVYWSQFFDMLNQTKAGVRNTQMTSPPAETDLVLATAQALVLDLSGVVYVSV